MGPHAGRKALTLKLAAPRSPSTVPKPFTVARDGFSLNAAVAFAAHEREGIERLCRYVTRPALALERLSTNEAGQVVYQLKHPYRDGTTHFVFDPLDFLARLAALVPRPRGNLVRYHGTATTVRPEREASKQGCSSHARSAASQPRAGPRSCAGHSAPRRRLPPTHGTHDLDGAPAQGVCD